MKKVLLFCLAFTLFALHVSAKKYLVRSQIEFENIIPSLLPGDVVTIANGNYENWAISLAAQGTANQPILIKAETTGKVIFSGNVSQTVFKLIGTHLILKGILFQECKLIKAGGKNGVLVELNNSNTCAVVDCHFVKNQSTVQFMPLVIISGQGTTNRIANCTFESNIDSQDIQVKVTKENCPQNTEISHNLFQNKAKVSWPNGNGGECIQVGQDPILLGNISANTLVTRNTFIHCDAENEVISNKSSKNTYTYNYFKVNDGELVMRGGHDCTISYNKFDGGTGGIRINGTGHTVTYNKISNIRNAIRLMYGMAKGKDEIGFYIAASNCSINYNTINNAVVGILVGDSKDVDWTGKFDTKRYPSPVLQNVAPAEIQVQGNKFSKTENEVIVIEE